MCLRSWWCLLFCQILFHLTIATIAEAMLILVSANQVPSLRRVAPMYLKLVTSSDNICINVIRAVAHDPALFCADKSTVAEKMCSALGLFLDGEGVIYLTFKDSDFFIHFLYLTIPFLRHSLKLLMP